VNPPKNVSSNIDFNFATSAPTSSANPTSFATGAGFDLGSQLNPKSFATTNFGQSQNANSFDLSAGGSIKPT